MKAAESKPAAKPTGNSTPFFSKESGQGFFGSNAPEAAFFSKTNTIPGIQPKLTIGQPNDKYELEADAMADKVVQRVSEPNTVKAQSLAPAISPLIQPKCATCEQADKHQKKEEEEDDELLSKKLQRKPVLAGNSEPPEDEKNIHRKCVECEKEEKVRTKADPGSLTASAGIESSIASSKGSGNPLPAVTRQQMEASFGTDFSSVRLHTDAAAVQMNKGLGAQAFTHGRDIYFNNGKYNAASTGGRHLLAHELTHVVQQEGNKGKVQRQAEPSALQQLDDALNLFDVPEELVIDLCGKLSDPEKQLVVAGGYKDRMVGALDINEMKRALNNLKPVLKIKLEWIDATVTFTSSIFYSEIQAWIKAAPQTERDELKTEDWKNYFVSVCDNTNITTAVTDLKFDLETQLNWVLAEATFTSWAFGYPDIQPLIVAAKQPDRDLLKTDTWRDFFVNVCDNVTIVAAVGDLRFDLKTQLEWLIAEGSYYDEFKLVITPATAAEKAIVLADTVFLRTLMGYFFWWDHFAKVAELLGRSSPTGATMMGDATVQATLSAAWAASGAALTTPGVAAPAGVHEEGGYIYLNLITGLLATSRAAAGAQASLPLDDPDPPTECITVGGFHTHPNVGPGWGAPQPSGADTTWATDNGIPLLLRGAFPTVAATSDNFTGSTRLHLAGGTGFPGSTGGVAPQADLENTFDEV
jgi:hypothetical protein